MAYRGQKVRPTISRQNLHPRRDEELSYFKPIQKTEIKSNLFKINLTFSKINLTYSK